MVNPLEFNSMDSRIPLENSHSYQLWYCFFFSSIPNLQISIIHIVENFRILLR